MAGENEEKKTTLMIRGDGGIGKTCLVMTYLTGKFPTEYVPTSYSPAESIVKVEGERGEAKVVSINVVDTAGREEYPRLIQLQYPMVDLFILAFALDSPTSFANTSQRWMPDIRHSSQAPVVLVGTKLDVRNRWESLDRRPAHLSNSSPPIRADQGLKLAKQIGALAYFECSAAEMIGVEKIFQESICLLSSSSSSSVPPKPNKSSKSNCTLL